MHVSDAWNPYMAHTCIISTPRTPEQSHLQNLRGGAQEDQDRQKLLKCWLKAIAMHSPHLRQQQPWAQKQQCILRIFMTLLPLQQASFLHACYIWYVGKGHTCVLGQ